MLKIKWNCGSEKAAVVGRMQLESCWWRRRCAHNRTVRDVVLGMPKLPKEQGAGLRVTCPPTAGSAVGEEEQRSPARLRREANPPWASWGRHPPSWPREEGAMGAVRHGALGYPAEQPRPRDAGVSVWRSPNIHSHDYGSHL